MRVLKNGLRRREREAGVAKGALCAPFATLASLSRRRSPFINTLIIPLFGEL
jgi:hypothetical protein